MSHRILSATCEDIRIAVEYYEQQSPGLRARFLDEFEAVLNRIKINPEAWTPVSPHQRRCLFRVFPFAVLYASSENELIVTAVMDLRMGPEKFRQRLSKSEETD